MLQPLFADTLKDSAILRHGFFTRHGGVSEGVYASLNCGLSCGDDPQAVLENRRRVAAWFGVEPSHLLTCQQIHAPDAVTVMDVWQKDVPKADAMVTRVKGLALGILTADCVPVLLADAGAGVIGAAHAGWRGAVGGVLENTVKAMEALGARRGSIQTALGPCIGQNSYEVGPEFPAPFLAENPDHQKFFRPAFRSDRYQFDLPGYVIAKLKALGVATVGPSPSDTCADEERFFSYRRAEWQGQGGKTGRLISAIMLAA